MRRSTIVGLAVFVGLVLVALSASAGRDAAPLGQVATGTGITYQGRVLDAASNPINGTCAMSFTLWTASAGGSQIGSAIVVTSVSMSNGYFATALDFGSAAWNGDARWLEPVAACNGGGAETFDRQAVTVVPYAVHSLDPTPTPLVNVAYTNTANVFTMTQKITPPDDSTPNALIITDESGNIKFELGIGNSTGYNDMAIIRAFGQTIAAINSTPTWIFYKEMVTISNFSAHADKANAELNIEVYNQHASSNSDAVMQMNVTGSTGGNPYLRFQLIDGTTYWAVGVDNSDNDKFKITPDFHLDWIPAVMTIQKTGEVGIGTENPTSMFQVVGLPVYTNTAAAIAGGLTAGAFYRTGGDPDVVCVVH